MRNFIACVWIATLPGSAAWAQRPMLPPAAPSEADVEKLTDAERVARLQRTVDEGQEQLAALKARLNDPKGEYKRAEGEFSDLDRQFTEARKELQRLQAEGASGLEERETALADIERKRTLARERFDLAIKERKATQDQIALLEQKLQQDRDALNKLLGVAEAKPAKPADPKNTAGAAPAQPPATAPVEPGSAPATTEAAAPVPGSTANGAGAAAPVAAGTPPALVPGAAPAPPKPPSEKVIKAQEEVTSKQAEAQEARQQAESVTERLESIRKVIDTERELRSTARRKSLNARQAYQTLTEEHAKKWDEGRGISWSSPELVELRRSIADAEARVREAEAEVQARAETLDARHMELAELQKEQIAALEQAKKKMEEAEAARAELEHLENPFAPRNIANWLIDHGPKIGFTFMAAIILLWLIQVLEHRMVRLITRHGVTGTPEERESRARTLAGVLQNASTVIVMVGAFLIIVAEAGFNITALLGATAVIGLAVAFGAQNLIRDYFYGFMILMENQYLVNDVVRLGDIAGQVERITLRVTVLRDLQGTVHFVPHGQITTVSNLTRGWSRVCLDIGVAYKEKVDAVIKVLSDLGREIRRDPAYRDLILDEPEMSGVDELGDSAVVIRMLIKTRPLKQWTVKREMLRRIKNRFDELGIEIPFPHRVVYNRYDSEGREAPLDMLDQPPAKVESEHWPDDRVVVG